MLTPKSAKYFCTALQGTRSAISQPIAGQIPRNAQLMGRAPKKTPPSLKVAARSDLREPYFGPKPARRAEKKSLLETRKRRWRRQAPRAKRAWKAEKGARRASMQALNKAAFT